MRRERDIRGPTLLVAPRGTISADGKKRPASDSKRLAALLSTFEFSLIDRFNSLVVVEHEARPGISLAYLARAVGVLSSVLAFAGALIDRFDEASLAAYISRSAKILQICSVVSTEIERLRGSRLHLLFAVRLLSGGTPTPDNLRKAVESIKKWDKSPTRARGIPIHIPEEDTAPKKGKITIAGRMLCAVDAASALVAEAWAIFSEAEPSLHKRTEMAGKFAWSDAFEKARGSLTSRAFRIAPPVEVEAVSAAARALAEIIDRPERTRSTRLSAAVNDLENAEATLTDVADDLRDAVDWLSRYTLKTRCVASTNYSLGASNGVKCTKSPPLFDLTAPGS